MHVLFLQHSSLLGLLALAGVPLLVHLLARAKPPQYRFSNVEFLKQVARMTSRIRKPKDWLLLALRTLAAAALAASFLGVILTSENSAVPGERRTLVLLIDRSASMMAKEGATSRFDAACAQAQQILNSLHPELANVVWIDATPSTVFPEPAPNRDFLNEELTRASARPEPGALQAAFESASRQLLRAGGRRELCVISDFQESTWKGFSPTIPGSVHVRLVPVAKSDVPNVAITSLVPLPASPVAGQPLVAQCRVANFSGEPRRISLTLDAGGSLQSQALDLAAHGEAEAVFQIHCQAAGLLPLTAETEPDAFPADDRRHAVVRVRESLRLAVAAAATDPSARTLVHLARSLPWLDARPDADLRALPRCEILSVPHWDGNSPETLRTLAANGTAVIIQATPGLPSTAVAALFGETSPPAAGLLPLESSVTGWQASPAADHPAFRLFAGGEFGNPLHGKFFRRVRLPDLPSTITAARFADGSAAMVEAKDRPLVLSNLPLDPAASTWTREAAFVPAFGEWLLHLMPKGTSGSFTAEPGGSLTWENPDTDPHGEPVLVKPDSTRPHLTHTGQIWQCSERATPGIHQWLISEQPVHLTAVNFPESESCLRPLAKPPPIAARNDNSSTTSDLSALSQGLPLWPWLAAATLAFLTLEGAISITRPRSTSTPAA